MTEGHGAVGTPAKTPLVFAKSTRGDAPHAHAEIREKGGTPMSFRKDALEERRQEFLPELAKAREIAEKAEAENRDLTDDEKAIYDPIIAKGKQLSADFEKLRSDESVKAWANNLAAEVGEALHGGGGGLGSGGAARTKGQRLSFKGMGRVAANRLLDGTKALAPSGATVVAQELTPDVVSLGKAPMGLLDVIPVIQHPTPEISYLRQTVRTNAAAVVAAGAQKPTSVYTVTKITNNLAVIAHLSEGIPRHWLIDNSALESWLDSELRYGLQVAVEAKILADVNCTSGIQAQAYATSVLATLRKGVTKLETAGYTASAFVLHPADWEGVELGLASQAAIEHVGLPYDPATRRLFSVPVTTSNAQTAGVGHALATGAVALDTDTRGVDVQYSENATATSFGTNTVYARCESRYATSIFSPLGVVTLDLTA
jgi:HK97 family phage major capsid protein